MEGSCGILVMKRVELTERAGKGDTMAWYEHLFGVLAILFIAGIPVGVMGILVVWYSLPGEKGIKR